MKFRVEYNEKWANPPGLKISATKEEEDTFNVIREGLRYREIRPGLYIGRNEPFGLVNFFAHVPEDEFGYGGAVFNITMEDGEKRSIKGPWSSRAGCFNTPDGEVAIVEAPINIWVQHWNLDFLQASIKENGQDIVFLKYLVGWENSQEVYYIPSERDRIDWVKEKLERQKGYYTFVEVVDN